MPNYDVAVVGAGIAGLSAAALLTAGGRKIVLVDPGERTGGAAAAVERDGFRFAAGPFAVYGLEQKGVLNALCSAAGVDIAAERRPARYQVTLPGQRITVSPKREETLEELRREFPREIDRIGLLYRDADKALLTCSSSRLSAYVAGRRSSAAFLRKYRFSPELTAFYDVQARYFFSMGIDVLPQVSLMHMLCTPPALFPGGYAGLAEQLASRVRERGGEVLLREPWPEVLLRGRNASGIRTSHGVYSAGTVLVNAGLGLSAGERTLFLGLRSDVIPVRMENTVLCLPDVHRTADYFSLTVSPDDRSAPTGMRSLAATFPASPGPLRTRIGDLIPFLDDFVVSEAEQETAWRRITLPEEAGPRRTDEASSFQVQIRGGAKNLLLMNDSTRLMLPSVKAAMGLAKRRV